MLLDSQKQTEESVGVLQAARQLNPSDFRIRSMLGRLLGATGRIREAATELEAAVNLNPEDQKIRHQLAVSLLQSGQAKMAVAHLANLTENNPGNASVHFLMGNCQRTIGNSKEAVRYYRRALKIDKSMLLAANNLAFLLATDDQVRNVADAVRVAEYVNVQTKRTSHQFLDTLSVAYVAANQYEKAITSAEQAVAILTEAANSNDEAIARLKARVEECRRKLDSP